ncbi:MAG TPA: hypothetical protein VGE52_21055, partial [Pirellulales bacterium]
MTPRTVSLRAFLLAMAGTTVGLAATAALMRRDFEASQAIVGSLLLVWCVGLVIAVAICSGRRRTIALAALAATCIHWRLAALSPTFVYYQSDFVTFTLLRGFWWWSGAETALIDQGSPALARFIENGLALASIWLGVLAGLVAWFGLRPYQEAPSVSHLNDASSKQSRVALVTEGESPAPRRVNCARVAKGALAFLLATIASIAVLVCRPLYVIPGGCGLLTIWCVGLIVATACSPRWRVPAAATLAATCLHWQFAGFSAVEGFYDLPSNWLADRFSDAWDPQAGLDAPDRTKEFDRFDSHDEYLAYWYAHDQYGAANDGQRSLAAALASMWLGIIVGLIVVWRRSTLHAFLDSPRDAGESSEEIRSSVGANQHRARRAYWIAGLVTALAGAFFALALGPDYFQPWFWLGMMAW